MLGDVFVWEGEDELNDATRVIILVSYEEWLMTRLDLAAVNRTSWHVPIWIEDRDE